MTPPLKPPKYYFPPPTITPTATYVPPSSVNPHILLSMPLLSVDIVFMSVNNRPQHSTFILSITYTPSFITITYKSYSVNTVQIDIKNNHHNPPTYYPYLPNLFP